MKLSRKDAAGFVLVAATLTTLSIHGGERHQESHVPPVAQAGGAATMPTGSRLTAFVDVSVLPMNQAGPAHHQVVLIRDGFIDEIGPVGAVDVPADATIVQGGGSQYLVPGLTDAHVHLPDADDAILPLFLANGVTTVFNLEGDRRHLDQRARSRAPDFVGPSILTAGPFIDESAVKTPADARRAVASQARAGYDFVKLHGSLTKPAYIALLDAARASSMAVVGHAPRSLPLSVVLDHGQAGVVHAEELIYTGVPSLDTTRAREVAAEVAEADIWVTPTMATFEAISEQWASPEGLDARLARPEAALLPRAMQRSWSDSEVHVRRPARERARIERMNAFHRPLVRALADAGVHLLTGTDAPLPGLVPGFSLHDELDALVSAGVEPEAVLRAATFNAGRFVRERVDSASHFGVIEPGARADLVLVEGDPRDDLRRLRKPLGVMARGTWYGRIALAQLLALPSRPAAVAERHR
jgi:imidazolonepropionase-like amidohydrolase